MSVDIYTIGFTKTSAFEFFDSLRKEPIKKLIDVRLNNSSQLSGFAKRDDLQFFLRELCDVEYIHSPDLAPTKEMLDHYKKHGGSWKQYETRFLELMYKRNIEKYFEPAFFDHGCLLCSEKLPHNCHRSLVVKYLQENWGIDIKVKHIV